MQRLEAALGAALALDLKGFDRRGEALEMLRTEIGKLEQPTYEPPGTPADDDAARFVLSFATPSDVLGIEPRRERRRAHQIHEHHGQLPPFRSRARGGRAAYG